MIDRLLERFGRHFILLMMIATRLFGSIGGLMVIYYVEFTMDMPAQTRTHFRVTCLIVVVIACTLSVLLALWETRRLRRVLKLLGVGEDVDPDLGAAAGREAVTFAGRHHKHEAWLVPCTTWLPVLIVLKVVDDASVAIMVNITIAVFMAISMAVMSHFYVIEHCMKTVVRYLLKKRIPIDYDSLKPGRLRVRMRVCFTLVIATTALMIGTVASQRASEMIANPETQVQSVHELRYHSVFITIAALVFGIVYATIVGDSVAQRVGSLVLAMDRVGGGDLSERVLTTGNDELDVLARRFNAMVEQMEINHHTIRDLNANLEKMVDQRTRELNGTVATLRETQLKLTAYNEELELARAEAETANKAKGEFLTNMSHELRTPLNGVIGLNELLLKTQLDAQQTKYAAAARASGESLLQLLNDLLDVSKIEAGKLELENIEFDLALAIESVMNTVAHRCEEGVELICSVDPRIPSRLIGDPGRLGQVITNLTNNALKFTERGEVLIRATMQHEDEHCVKIAFEVRDTGIGIRRDQLDRIFEAFTQADASTTRKYGGTGLGLGICKQLCELMDGDVSVVSELGEGSRFIFTVVLEKAPAEHQLVVTVPDEIVGANVLVVDNNQSICDTLCEQLTARGLEVDCVRDADACVAQLGAARARDDFYDLILMDHSIIQASPASLATAIKQGADLSGTALIALVPLAAGLGMDVLGESGFDDHLTKPVMPGDMVRTISRCLRAATDAREEAIEEAIDDGADNSKPCDEAGQPTTKSSRPRILLAEDQEINQLVVMESLSQAGYECDVVNNGKEAVETLERCAYDLVLMDCQMPEMDGFKATQAIREMESAQAETSTPVIALTANAMQGERERCLNAGMTDYLSKPIHPDLLIDTIAKHLSEYERLLEGEVDPSTDACESGGAPADQLEDVLNMETLLQRCHGKSELAFRLLAKFESRLPGDLSKARQSIESGDAETLADVAHAIKGVAASLGAGAIQSAAAALEDLGRSGSLQGVDAMFEELSLQQQRFQDYLKLATREPAETQD